MLDLALDARPIIVMLAGPNGAGKSTFYHAFLRDSGLRFLNVDDLSRGLGYDAYTSARVAAELRNQLVEQRESFIFETVFSDPVGDKLSFLSKAAEPGYTVILCYIGISDSDLSDTRVAMRVSQGGHDVPADKVISRFPRSLLNLQLALHTLPWVLVFDNSDLATPYRRIAEFTAGAAQFLANPLPKWFAPLAGQSSK